MVAELSFLVSSRKQRRFKHIGSKKLIRFGNPRLLRKARDGKRAQNCKTEDKYKTEQLA